MANRGRIRTIKPQFWSDGKILRLTDQQTLLFIALWNFADDEGKFRFDYDEIAANIPRVEKRTLPHNIKTLYAMGFLEGYRDMKKYQLEHNLTSTEALLEPYWWSTRGQLTPYWPSTDYLLITNWSHQRINRFLTPKINLSDLTHIPRCTAQNFDEHSVNDMKNACLDRIGKDRKGKDRKSILRIDTSSHDEAVCVAESVNANSAEETQKPLLPENTNAQLPDKGTKKKSTVLHQLAVIWNENCGTLPKCNGTSGSRLKHCAARWSELSDAAYWTSVAQAISRSDFCNGNNASGWRATFDFFIKPNTHLKVTEGTYQNRSAPNHTKTFTQQRTENNVAIAKKIAAGEVF